MSKLDNSFFWADWYVGHYNLKINANEAYRHYIDNGYRHGLNPNPLISSWWVQKIFGISSFDDFYNHIRRVKRSHPFFNVETFAPMNDVWRYYANNAREKILDPCAELGFHELTSLDNLQNVHFLNIFLILGELYRTFTKNSLKIDNTTQANFLSSL
jgi:hypothetical protein